MVLSEMSFTVDMDDEDDVSILLLVPVVRAQHMTSAVAIADLLHLQSVYWGVNHIPISFLQPVNAALAVVLSDMESIDHKSSFVKLAIALNSLARRSVTAEGLLRILRLKLRRRGLMSSTDIENMFQDANAHWDASIFSSHLAGGRGLVPAQFGQDATVAVVEVNYESLVEKWSHFDVGAFASSASDSASS